jgi:hypothetical protein
VIAAATGELLELWRAGTIRPHVVESRRSVGKVVLVP